ncbi:hypothetical protein IKF20_02685 [Candidatus Saccharibacteria bacterium]|nr:hypothetical protein [Candidatus Saccharibacteria bacterium]
MFKTLLGNLTKNQKIVLVVIAQILVIAIIASVLQFALADKPHATIDDANDSEMPGDAEDFIEENIWQLIESNVPNVDRNNIKDVTIREGTYEESENEDGSISVNFIVDIDSLKQTYTVSTGWSKDKSVVYEVIVDCPPQELMKYPETVCQGTYNNTYSLDLYLPYVVDSSIEDAAPLVFMDGNESKRTIDVTVSACNPEQYKKLATDYLDSTPLDLSEYTINFEVSSTDAICEEE